MDESERQAVIDAEHLRLLSLLHYISGGVTLVFSIGFGLMILFVSVLANSLPPPHPSAVAQHFNHGPPPLIFFLFFATFCLLGAIYGVLEIFAGRFISRRVHRMFSLIVSIPRLITIPYGVILSVFTVIVLERSSVKQLYRENLGP
jgi:hypothetical protein